MKQANIRPASESDLAQVIALDKKITGQAKRDYWRSLFARYQTNRPGERFFFVADAGVPGGKANIAGFIIGEVRAWEFGSAPCGWVFAISVDPDARLDGTGQALLDAIEQGFKSVGVAKLRTMISTSNHLLLSFFRAQGLMAGPYLQLEKDLDD